MCLFTYTSTKNIKRNIKLRKLTTKITNLNVDVMIRVQIVQLTCPLFFVEFFLVFTEAYGPHFIERNDVVGSFIYRLFIR